MWYLVLSRSLPENAEMQQRNYDDHRDWLEEQHRAGRLLFSGPTSDRAYGIYVMLASSLSEAKALAAQDPHHARDIRTWKSWSGTLAGLFEWTAPPSTMSRGWQRGMNLPRAGRNGPRHFPREERRMVRTMRSLTLCLSLIWAVALVGPAYAQSSDPFYQGKMLRFIVGASAGGGFDTYTRLLARHVGKHIPGNPSTIVANMPGAGHLIAANYMYAKAKPDGLTIGNWVGGLVFKQVAGQGQGIRFDARKFEWVGLPVSDSMVCS